MKFVGKSMNLEKINFEWAIPHPERQYGICGYYLSSQW